MRTFIPLIFISIFLVATPSQAELLRANHGATHYPIWSELTYFERTTLGDLHLARSNQPDALLALYLVASGIRELDAFESANRRIKAFVEIIEERQFDADDPIVLGEVVNRQMHEHFFLRKSDSKAPSGYATDQSRLMGIFETGEFNCISSALLYAVIMREFGISTLGVLLPSHAFIQLNTRKGYIDVETTSPEGFAQPHTREFYQKQSSNWYSDRELAPATYSDYLNRERISLTVLGARNMLNQHTRKLTMTADDRARLGEISAFINPEDINAQIRRLFYYTNELHHLAAKDQWPTLLRLYQTTYRQVLFDATQMTDSYASAESSPKEQQHLKELLHYYQLGALLTFAHHADADKVIELLEDILPFDETLPPIQDQEAHKSAKDHVAHSIQVLADKLIEQDRYEDALFAVPIAEVLLPDHSAWQKIIRHIYWEWANQYWQQNAWQDVIQVTQDWLDHPGQNTGDKQALLFAAKAYEQLVKSALDNHEMPYATDTIATCKNTFTQHPKTACGIAEKRLQQYQRRHQGKTGKVK